MARIVISTSGGLRDAALLAKIRGITREPVSHIAAALRDGAPLFDDELFRRPQEEQFEKVRGLLEVLRSAGVQPVVSEDGRPIRVDVLLNIMESSEETLAWFREMDDLGHVA